MGTNATRAVLFLLLAWLGACRSEGLQHAAAQDGGRIESAPDGGKIDTSQSGEPPTCASHTDAASCEAQGSQTCHAIFASADQLSCTGCAPGFLSCADGPARCLGSSCGIKPLICSPGYRVGYEPNGGCEEGCVRESACSFDKNDCRMNGCAAGLDCIQCGSLAWECLPDCA